MGELYVYCGPTPAQAQIVFAACCVVGAEVWARLGWRRGWERTLAVLVRLALWLTAAGAVVGGFAGGGA